MSGVCRDLKELDPSFCLQVMKLLDLMRADGFNPVVWETLRSPSRALELSKRGTGSATSMHIYRVACDIVDGDLYNMHKQHEQPESYWDAPPEFWASLHKRAISLGLTRLVKPGAKTSWDGPHVQACTVAQQAKVRAMTDPERAAWCAARFGV